MSVHQSIDVAPSAARLTSSLRDIGYDFPTAVADLVDNSVAAGASRINIETVFEPNDSYVLITDDGEGMSEAELHEALRFGTRRSYRQNELGRFGLGLKTGSLSQCRRLTVVTRSTPKLRKVRGRTLDLDRIERTDRWVVTAEESTPAIDRARSMLAEGRGTVVVWEALDRVLPERYAESGWGRRRLATLAKATASHLAMVFHRFIAGEVEGRSELVISVNGEKLAPWNPFAPDEADTVALPHQSFELETVRGSSQVTFKAFVLPARDRFSSPEEFENLSGPQKWNRQQGLYIYRANRLVQHGGWSGVRGIDEHTKLARAAIDFDTDLDEAFQINVAKMRVALPPALKQMLEAPIHELCILADDAYRRSANARSGDKVESRSTAQTDLHSLAISLKSALLTNHSLSEFRSALDIIRREHSDLAKFLELDSSG